MKDIAPLSRFIGNKAFKVVFCVRKAMVLGLMAVLVAACCTTSLSAGAAGAPEAAAYGDRLMVCGTEEWMRETPPQDFVLHSIEIDNVEGPFYMEGYEPAPPFVLEVGEMELFPIDAPEAEAASPVPIEETEEPEAPGGPAVAE